MKLIIQIPCYNEEQQLANTLKELPKKIEGIDQIELLIIDDGSTDRTVEIAKSCGVHHIVQLYRNQGLAKAFSAGIRACLDKGADIIVNTDADNQYAGDDIESLIRPILSQKYDLVVGSRPINEIAEFSAVKKTLQKVGSWVVRIASNTTVEDAPSGFRAISREAAYKLHVFNRYTYTLETLIQAGQNGMSITTVPVRVNPPTRPSRLVRNNLNYVVRSCLTILRVFTIYKPLRFFTALGCIPFCSGVILGLRFLVSMAIDNRGGQVQSLILSAILIVIGANLWVLGIIADLISVNRNLLENIEIKIQKQSKNNSNDF